MTVYSIQYAASAVLTQKSLMLNPQNVPLLEELSLDKLKKFELATVTLSYTSDILAYAKSTMVAKVALNPIEKYSQESNADWYSTDFSNRLPHSTTLEVIHHIISLKTGSGTSHDAIIEALKSIRISLHINRAQSLNNTSISDSLRNSS